MTDKYFMSGIYNPQLYSQLSSILPLVRELNYKYGLKVASQVATGFNFAMYKHAVLMSYPSGINVCAVWHYDGKHYLYSPHIRKSRGADDYDRSTISGKTVGIVTGLLNKYGGIPDEQTSIQRQLTTSNMASMAYSSVKGPSNPPNRYSLDDHEMSDLVHFAGHHLGLLGENPNCQIPRPDPKMIAELIQGYARVQEVNDKRKALIEEMFSQDLLMVGSYPLTGEQFIPGVAGVVRIKRDDIPKFSYTGSTHVYEVVKPFGPVRSFEEVLDKYPEAMTRLILAKARMEENSDGRIYDLGFLKVMDHYEECVPYSVYYHKRNPFSACWFATPIEISDADQR